MTSKDEFEEGVEADLGELRRQISYLQETLGAISSGGVDAVVMGNPEQEQVYTLTSADRPYRVIVERMGEGAATVSERGVILFANPQLAHFLGIHRDSMIGRDITDYVSAGQQLTLASLLDTEATETHRAELTLESPGDRPDVPVLVASTALDLEGVLVRCLVFTDLTMQKVIEAQVAEEAAQAERQRVAREVNDTIVQGSGDCGDGARPRALRRGAQGHRQHVQAGPRAGSASSPSTTQVMPGTAVRSQAASQAAGVTTGPEAT